MKTLHHKNKTSDKQILIKFGRYLEKTIFVRNIFAFKKMWIKFFIDALSGTFFWSFWGQKCFQRYFRPLRLAQSFLFFFVSLNILLFSFDFFLHGRRLWTSGGRRVKKRGHTISCDQKYFFFCTTRFLHFSKWTI